MAVTVENQGGTYYVNNKPDNVPAGNLGGAGTHLKCDNKEQAEAIKEQLEGVNKAAIQEGTPQVGQGAALNTAAYIFKINNKKS